MIVTNMKKQILLLTLNLLFNLPVIALATTYSSNETNQVINHDDLKWRIGGKIHFEEDNGPDYIGLKEINKVVRDQLKKIVSINADVCSTNAKILLKREAEGIQITHFKEKSRPGTGEEMHATLLYTQPRGFHSSETLRQVCENLFERCDSPPSIENVVTKYSSIIKPDWKFKISEVVLTTSITGTSFIMANLLFEGHECIFMDNKPISAGLHMTLVNFDNSLLPSDEINRLVKEINLAIKDKMIKVSSRNGIPDLEFGLSGSSWRIRAGEHTQ